MSLKEQLETSISSYEFNFKQMKVISFTKDVSWYKLYENIKINFNKIFK